MHEARLTPYETAFEVVLVDGEVVVLGPGPIHAAFTPKAALESGERLRRAAQDIMGLEEPRG